MNSLFKALKYFGFRFILLSVLILQGSLVKADALPQPLYLDIVLDLDGVLVNQNDEEPLPGALGFLEWLLFQASTPISVPVRPDGPAVQVLRRISIFTSRERSSALQILDRLKMPSGLPLRERLFRVLTRESLTPGAPRQTSLVPMYNISLTDKKDLLKVVLNTDGSLLPGSDLKRVVLIDDSPGHALKGQEDNLLFHPYGAFYGDTLRVLGLWTMRLISTLERDGPGSAEALDLRPTLVRTAFGTPLYRSNAALGPLERRQRVETYIHDKNLRDSLREVYRWHHRELPFHSNDELDLLVKTKIPSWLARLSQESNGCSEGILLSESDSSE